MKKAGIAAGAAIVLHAGVLIRAGLGGLWL